MAKWYFGPHGYPMQHVVTRGWQSAPLKVDNDGTVVVGDSDDFPNMESYDARSGEEFLIDEDGSEFLVWHCRCVEVYGSFDSSDFDFTTDPAIEPWSDAVIAACVKVASLEDMAQAFDEARRRAPSYIDDTQKAVLDRIIFGKIDAQVAECEEQIEAYRQAHPDPERLEDPDEGTPVDRRIMVEGDL